MRWVFALGVAVVTGLFLGFTNTGVSMPWLLILSLAGACAAYAGTVTLCGALVAHASNRTALAGVLAVPLLLPLSFMSVSALRVALGTTPVFDTTKGMIAGFGLLTYGLATLAVGPYMFKAVWKS